MKFLFSFQEIPAQFKQPLKDVTAKETDNITLECELNKTKTPVKWLKDGKPITPDNRVRFNVDGYIHQLLIDDVTLDDRAKYSCMCGDVSTKATLAVDGKCQLSENVGLSHILKSPM